MSRRVVLLAGLVLLAALNLALLPSTFRDTRPVAAAWLVQTPPAVIAPAADRRPFVPEGTVLSSTELVNFDVFALGDGGYRMLLHTSSQHVRSAVSRGGRAFTMEAGDRLRGSMTATTRTDDGRWRVYYVSGQGAPMRSAISRDGLHFTPEPGVRLGLGPAGAPDSDGLIHPCILRLPDGRWRLYYDGVSPNPGLDAEREHPLWTTLSATSSDGLSFARDEGIRLPSQRYTTVRGPLLAEWSCDVKRQDGAFVMYVTCYFTPFARSGIYRATSPDGLRFALEDTPAIGLDPQYLALSEDDGGGHWMPQDPCLLETPQGERLFYFHEILGTRSAFRAARP